MQQIDGKMYHSEASGGHPIKKSILTRIINEYMHFAYIGYLIAIFVL